MKIAVVGAGIIGMSTAALLQETGHDVDVFSRHDLSGITSSVAAAMIYPYGVEDSARVQGWLRVTENYLEKLKDIPDAGVVVTNWKKCAYAADTPIPAFFHTLRNSRVLMNDELPKGFAKGIGAELFMMNSQVHLPYILNRLQAAGGHLHMKTIGSINDLSDKYDCIVNATGVYAAEFTGDSSVEPGRGQVVIVRNPGVDIHFSTFEGRHYVYPRGDECILGGSMDIGVWDRTPDDALTRKILDWACEFDARFQNVEVLDVKVGLRPMRAIVRLELDQSYAIPVIHNYGHGGAGYTLSWGCAFAVCDIVEGL